MLSHDIEQLIASYLHPPQLITFLKQITNKITIRNYILTSENIKITDLIQYMYPNIQIFTKCTQILDAPFNLSFLQPSCHTLTLSQIRTPIYISTSHAPNLKKIILISISEPIKINSSSIKTVIMSYITQKSDNQIPIINTPNIHKLQLNNVHCQLIIPKHPNKLHSMILDTINIKTMDDTFNAPNLQFLHLITCPNLTTIDMTNYPHIQELIIYNCRALKTLSTPHTKIKILTISSCPTLTHINMPPLNLTKFNIDCITKSTNLNFLQFSTKIKEIELSKCVYEPKPINLNFLSLNRAIHTIKINMPFEPISIPLLCPNLTTFFCTNTSTENLDFLTNCQNLQEILLMHNYSLNNIDGISSCIKLSTIYIEDCPNLISLRSLKTHNLTQLSIINCPKTLLPSHSILQSLTYLSIHTNKLKHIPSLPNLITLSIAYCDNLIYLNNLANSLKLEYIIIYNCKKLKNINPLSSCPHLINVQLCGCTTLLNIDALKLCNKLKYVCITNCFGLSMIPDFGPNVQFRFNNT